MGHPCLPFAGIQSGFFATPDIGSKVWVEFEQGDPDFPIWSGCFWGTTAEVPALALAVPPGLQQIVVQTVGQNTLMISDMPGPTGGILLKSTTGAPATPVPVASAAYDPGEAARLGFTHLLGPAKQDTRVTDRLEARIRRESPKIYRRCQRGAAYSGPRRSSTRRAKAGAP